MHMNRDLYFPFDQVTFVEQIMVFINDLSREQTKVSNLADSSGVNSMWKQYNFSPLVVSFKGWIRKQDEGLTTSL